MQRLNRSWVVLILFLVSLNPPLAWSGGSSYRELRGVIYSFDENFVTLEQPGGIRFRISREYVEFPTLREGLEIKIYVLPQDVQMVANQAESRAMKHFLPSYTQQPDSDVIR